MITRRRVLAGLGAVALSATALAGYAFGIEPRYRLAERRYRVTPPGWPKDFKLTLAVVADLHVSEPYMPADRVSEIVAQTNKTCADAILLLGDYITRSRWYTRTVAPDAWARRLADLKAPLGVHSVLGNHDFWDDAIAQRAGTGPVFARRALENVGIPVYENDAVRLSKDGQPFWLAGLGDQIAFFARRENGRRYFRGVDDLAGTLGKITDNAPVILMAHEPDVFVRVPNRVALTISGHTHGGQVRLFGYSPIVPSRYGNRFAYGHIIEDGRHLVVSGGLGCSVMPVRFGVPPEIVVIELGGGA